MPILSPKEYPSLGISPLRETRFHLLRSGADSHSLHRSHRTQSAFLPVLWLSLRKPFPFHTLRCGSSHQIPLWFSNLRPGCPAEYCPVAAYLCVPIFAGAAAAVEGDFNSALASATRSLKTFPLSENSDAAES